MSASKLQKALKNSTLSLKRFCILISLFCLFRGIIMLIYLIAVYFIFHFFFSLHSLTYRFSFFFYQSMSIFERTANFVDFYWLFGGDIPMFEISAILRIETISLKFAITMIKCVEHFVSHRHQLKFISNFSLRWISFRCLHWVFLAHYFSVKEHNHGIILLLTILIFLWKWRLWM